METYPLKFINALGVRYHPTDWLAFDDVIMTPNRSDLTSRNDPNINLGTKLTNKVALQTPIISANMDTITGAKMAKLMHKKGGIGILHRFYPNWESFQNEVYDVWTNTGWLAISVGLKNSANDDIAMFSSLFKDVHKGALIVCIDVAHGHMDSVLKRVKLYKNAFGEDIQVIAGNVATPNGAKDLVEAGVDAIKVGVGCGSMCTTRIITGHGVPQLSAIMTIRKAIGNRVPIIADGGIKNSGDIVKALSAGASTVMIGRILAGTAETPGNIYGKHWRLSEISQWENLEEATKYGNRHHWLKKYRGQSSQDFMESIGKTGVAPEGESMLTPYIGPAEPILDNLISGIKSGMTYSGARNLDELFKYGTFMEISNHGYIEGTPHGLPKGS
jgi:IMP dehydrogenase